MKNLKKIVFGLLAMLVMVTGVKAGTTNSTTDLQTCIDGSESVCEISKSFALDSDLTVKRDITIEIRDGVTLHAEDFRILVYAGANLTIEGGTIESAYGRIFDAFYTTTLSHGSLTLDGTTIDYTGRGNVIMNSTNLDVVMDGATINAANASKVVESAATVTIKNSTINAAKASNIIEGKNKVVVENSTITGGDTTTAIYASDSGNVVELNANITAGSVLSGTNTAKLTVNGGAYEATKGNVFATPTAEVVINDGTFAADAGRVLYMTGGKLTIEEGIFTAPESDAIYADLTSHLDLTINGGSFTAKDFAVYVDYKLAGATAVVNDGKFVSTDGMPINFSGASVLKGGSYEGKEVDDVYAYVNQKVVSGYAAQKIGNVVYVGKAVTLKAVCEPSENGTVSHCLESYTVLLGHEYDAAELPLDIQYTLSEGYELSYKLTYTNDDYEVVTVENAQVFTLPVEDIKTGKDITLTVSVVEKTPDEPSTDEPVVDPSNDGEPAGDETEGKVPSTFDGIASIVTMAISSVSAAGYSIKKIIRK